MPILERLEGPADLRGLNDAQLKQLAAEIRETIIRTVAETGGHLGSSRSASSSSRSRCTGCWTRRATASSGTPATRPTRTSCSPAATSGSGHSASWTASAASRGAPSREHDVFDGGHAGTGLSIAEGLATARDLRGTPRSGSRSSSATRR